MKKYYEIFDEARGKIPEHEVRELILWASHMNMGELLNCFTDDAPDEIASLVAEAVSQRAAGRPLQYITHVQNFCGLDFYVDERVLIPRYDTEVLVEKILADVVSAQDSASAKRVLDLCTGSGCIAIALAKLGGFDVTACDISRDALEVADMNAASNGVDITFYESDMFSRIPCAEDSGDIAGQGSICPDEQGGFDIIVSNPPYIRSSVIETLGTDVKDHEPRIALDGTEDGLKFYRIIANEAPKYFRRRQRTGGDISINKADMDCCCGRLYLEIGYDQAEDVKKLLMDAGFTGITVTKDLAGLDRVVSAVFC